MEMCFVGSFESSKELDCDTVNIYSILDFMQVLTINDDQLNFEDTT